MSINESPAANILIDAGINPDAGDRDEIFLRACKDGHLDVVQAFLDLGLDVNATRDPIQESTGVLRAAEGGHEAIMSLLIDRGANLEARDGSDDTALQTALNWSHPEIARLLAKRGADIESPSKYGESTLDHNVGEGKDDNVAMLLELGANPAFTKLGRSPMRTAIDKDRADLVRTFVDVITKRGGSLGFALDDYGVTPLHEAVRDQKSEIVTILLEAGAPVNVKDAFGNTPVDYALFVDNEHLVQQLVDAGARQPAVPQRARASVFDALKPIEPAASDADEGAADEHEHDRDDAGDVDDGDGDSKSEAPKRLDVAAAIAAMGRGDVSVDARNHKHQTALMVAAEAGDIEGVRLLLKRGAHPSLAVGETTALGNALNAGFVDVVKALLDAGAAPIVTVANNRWMHEVVPGLSGAAWSGTKRHLEALALVLDRCTPAQKKSQAFAGAARSGAMQKNVALIKLLVEKGVIIDGRDEITDETALDGAISSWHSHEVAVACVVGGTDVNAAAKNGDTPMHEICGYHSWNDEAYEPTLRYLVEKGARFDGVNWLGQTPWNTASRNGARDAMARAILDKSLKVAQSWATLPAYMHVGDNAGLLAAIDGGVNPNPPPNVKAETILHYAIEKQDVELVKALLTRGVDINRAEKYGTTPLMAAVDKDSTEIVDALLAAGADVNATTPSMTTAVDYALKKPAHMKKLLDKGARVDARASSAILWACAEDGVPETLELLVKAGAYVDARDSYGRTGLVKAIESEREDAVRLLLDAGASLTRENRDNGEIPATAAAKQGHVAIMKLLLDRGASLDAKNRAGEDVLSLIMRRKALRTAFADMLAARGIDVAVPKPARLDKALTDVTPAWAAVYRGDASSVSAAIDAKVLDVNARDAWGVTPLMVAVHKRDHGLVHALLERGADAEIVNEQHKAVAGDFMGLQRDSELHELLLEKAPKANEAMHGMDRLNGQASVMMAFDEVTKAIERGEMKKVAALVAEKKAHPYLGRPLLLRALDADDEDLVTMCLDLGLSPLVGEGDETALALALRNDKRELAARLVEGGADVDAAFVAAASDGNKESVAWLLEHGARINDARDAAGRTALLAAVSRWYSCEDVAKELIARGADVNAFDNEGRTALHHAVDNWEEGAARFLLSHGANWDFTAPVDGAISARARAADQGMPQDWPPAARSDDDRADDDSADDDSADDSTDDSDGDGDGDGGVSDDGDNGAL